MPPQSTMNMMLYDQLDAIQEPPTTSKMGMSPRTLRKKKMENAKRNRVTLAMERNQIEFIRHVDDMTDMEIDDIWYCREDYDMMKKAFVPTIRKMMTDGFVPETEHQTTRGLEYRTKDGATRRQKNKLRALQIVLDEQDRQFDNGVEDQELISMVYMSCSRLSALAARQLGERDENFVRALAEEEFFFQHEVPKQKVLTQQQQVPKQNVQVFEPEMPPKRKRSLVGKVLTKVKTALGPAAA